MVVPTMVMVLPTAPPRLSPWRPWSASSSSWRLTATHRACARARSPAIWRQLLLSRYNVKDLSLPFVKLDQGEDYAKLFTKPGVPMRKGEEEGKHQGAKAADPRQCFKAWHAAFRDMDPRVFRRCAAAWDRIEDVFCSGVGEVGTGEATAAVGAAGMGEAGSEEEVVVIQHQHAHPDIAATLLPGASRRYCDEVARLFGADAMHPSLAALYRTRNGQSLWNFLDGDPTLAQRHEILLGMFGGYMFYDHLVNVRMLSLAGAVRMTKLMKLQAGAGGNPVVGAKGRLLAVAADFQMTHAVFVDVQTGEVRVKVKNWHGHEPGTLRDEMSSRPAAPTGVDVLGWFEEYSRRLAAGVYCVKPMPGVRGMLPPAAPGAQQQDPLAVTQFPQAAAAAASLSDSASDSTPACPVMYEAVSRGAVRIRVSTLYVAEDSSPDENLFTYSVTMDMLSAEEQRQRWAASGGGVDDGLNITEFHPMTSAQLKTRQWIITDRTGKKTEVKGEAVIGEYPLLRAGGEPFVYQSCTGCDTPGTMEGGFMFVEGSIASPTGREFFADCPLFRLCDPGFIF